LARACSIGRGVSVTVDVDMAITLKDASADSSALGRLDLNGR
jgi:hypothetical protein